VLQGYDNSESSVRKAAVFCLVAVYLVVGEELRPHLAPLSTSKVLNLLIHELSIATPRVTTHLENLGKSGNSKVVREKSGKMEKVRGSEMRCVFSSSKYSKTRFFGRGKEPRTPLGELTTFPQTT